MRTLNAEIMTGAQISEFDKMRRAIVARRFSDEILFERFRLSPLKAAFAREYALSRNAEKAARLAGYSQKTAHHNAARMVKATAKAVQLIRGDLENIGAEFRAGLAEYLANGLLEIFEMRLESPGAAVNAARLLSSLFLDVGNVQEKIEDVEILSDHTNTQEIENEILKMGIYTKDV